MRVDSGSHHLSLIGRKVNDHQKSLGCADSPESECLSDCAELSSAMISKHPKLRSTRAARNWYRVSFHRLAVALPGFSRCRQSMDRSQLAHRFVELLCSLCWSSYQGAGEVDQILNRHDRLSLKPNEWISGRRLMIDPKISQRKILPGPSLDRSLALSLCSLPLSLRSLPLRILLRH